MIILICDIFSEKSQLSLIIYTVLEKPIITENRDNKKSGVKEAAG